MLQNGLDRSNDSAANQRRETIKKDEATDDDGGVGCLAIDAADNEP